MENQVEKSAENENSLLVSNSVTKNLPSMVRNELAKMSPQKQEEFVEEYKRKEKSVGMGYVCWFLLGIQYAYVHKWGLQIIYWLTGGGFLIWMFIDLFRMPKIIGDYNKDLATDIMRNLKAIS